MRVHSVFLCLAVALGAGCSDTDPIASEFGSATTVLSDDPTSTAALHGPSGSAGQQGALAFDGTFTGGAQVEVSADGETWVELGAPSSVAMELQSNGGETILRSNVAIPVGGYSRVRLTLSGARADIDAGATLGGVTFTGAVSLDVGGTDGEVVIEKSVEPFTVTADTHARILFDLNSEIWVNQDNAQQQQASDKDVDDATTADRDIEPRED